MFIYACVCIGCVYTCIDVYIYVCVLAVLGLGCYSCFSVAVASRGYSLVAGRKLLIAAASLVVEHSLWSVQASVVGAPGL